MASLFQKIAAAIARPFTKHLRLHLDEAFKQQRRAIRAEISAWAKHLQRETAEIKARLLEHSQYMAENLSDSRFLEHSRYMAENLELLCSMQTTLCEKQDIALRRFAFPLDDQRALVRTAVGYMTCSRVEASLVAGLTETGDLEPGLRRFLECYLTEGMTFIDVGAHIGMHTVAAARCVGRKGKVHAFEATPDTAQHLRQNVVQNGLEEQTTVHSCFAGAASGVTSFRKCRISRHNSKFDHSDVSSTIEVPVVALDDALADERVVDLIKVDVEGAELEVFAGMSQLIQRNPDVCVIAEFAPVHLDRSGTQKEDWIAFCDRNGFAVFIVDEPSGNLLKTTFANLMSASTSNILMTRGNRTQKFI